MTQSDPSSRAMISTEPPPLSGEAAPDGVLHLLGQHLRYRRGMQRGRRHLCAAGTQPPHHKAVTAFNVGGAIDYLLKPIRQDRPDEAVRRMSVSRSAEPTDASERDSDVIPAELGGVTRLVSRESFIDSASLSLFARSRYLLRRFLEPASGFRRDPAHPAVPGYVGE